MARALVTADGLAGFVIALTTAELPDGTILKTPGSSSYGPLPRNGTPACSREPKGPIDL